MYDMIIVGGGPAALSAAMYALAKNLDVVMLYDQLGGQVGWHPVGPDIDQFSADARRRQTHDQPDLPGDRLLRLLVEATTEQPGRIVHDRAITIDRGINMLRVDTQAHGVLETATVVMATGAAPITLKVPGAARFTMHGLGYSVRTYAHLVTGKPVVVIGSTLRALRGTAELARIAERVYVVAPYPGALETPLGQALADRPNIELLQHYHVKELVGINRLEEVIIARDGDTRRLHVAHAFVDLGLVPNSQAVQRLGVTNSAGFIEVDRQNATTVPGLYAAGDVTTAAGEQVLVAIGDGARAAMSGYDYLLARWLAGAVQERAVGE